MIEPVHGAGDPRLSDFRHVGDPRWLRAHGLFVAEGRLVVARLLTSSRFTARSILVTPAALRGMHTVLSEAAASLPVFVGESGDIESVTGFDFHRGCLALGERGSEDVDMAALRGARLLIGLEGIGNPDNVGGIFRTAAALGVEGVLLDGSCGDPLYRKAIRTSMGATLRVPYTRLKRWPDDLGALRNAGFTVVATTPAANADDIAAYAARSTGERLVVLFGSEGGGLSEAALAASAARVRIPVDPLSDSLNVVVAAGIALHRLSARRPW